MQNSNKRKNSTERDKNPKAQRSTANFFGDTEKEVTDLFIDPKEEEPTKPEFYTSCMYTEEFDLLLDTVLKDERFLFNEPENETFNVFKSLQGFFFFF